LAEGITASHLVAEERERRSPNFGASALIKLLIVEPGSVIARQAWPPASTVACARLLPGEAHAGLAGARRNHSRKLSDADLKLARPGLDEAWRRIVKLDTTGGSRSGRKVTDGRLPPPVRIVPHHSDPECRLLLRTGRTYPSPDRGLAGCDTTDVCGGELTEPRSSARAGPGPSPRSWKQCVTVQAGTPAAGVGFGQHHRLQRLRLQASRP
jgi:hypothetical protein